MNKEQIIGLKKAEADLSEAEKSYLNKDITISLQLAEQAAAKFEESKAWASYGKAISFLVEFCISQGDAKAAIEWLQKLEDFYKDLAESSDYRAYIYVSRAKILAFKGDTDAIIHAYHQALDLLLQTTTQPNLYLLAEVYTQLGNFYLEQNDTQQALVFLQKSLALPLAENHPKSLYRFLAYAHLARYYSGEEGAYQKAIEYQKKTLQFVLKHYPSSHRIIAISYIRIGVIYIMKSMHSRADADFDQAIQYFQLALESQNPKEEPVVVASAYQNIGYVYLERKMLKEAHSYLSQALELYLSFYGNKHPVVGQMYNNLGRVYLQKGTFDAAKQSYQNALNSLYPNCDIQHDLSLQPPAVRSTNLYHAITALKGKGQAFFSSFLETERASHDLVFAIETYLLACQTYNNAWTSYDFDESKFSVEQAVQDMQLFEKGLEAALKAQENLLEIKGKKGNEWAFYFCESVKAGVLMHAIQENGAKASANISSTLLEKEKELQTHLTQLDKNIQKLNLKQDKSTLDESEKRQLEEWQESFFEAHRAYLQLKEELKKRYPEYFQLKYHTQTVTVTALQSVLNDNQVLLNYFVGEKEITIFVVTATDFEIVREDLPADFDEKVKSFLQSIKHHDFEKQVILGTQLYKILLQSVEDYFIDLVDFEPSLKHLLIIPHNILYYLPFEALIRSSNTYSIRQKKSSIPSKTQGKNQPKNAFHSNPDLAYLVKYVAVSYHYSASLFHYLHQKEAALKQDDCIESFGGFAPVYGSPAGDALLSNDITHQSEANVEVMREGDSLVSLPYSEIEVQNIARLFEEKGLTAKAYLHEAATKKCFEQTSSHYRYLLVAAHGLVNDEKTVLSGLVFFDEKQDAGSKKQEVAHDDSTPTSRFLLPASNKDCILSMEETYQLNLKSVDLVVLSSCDSGVGRLVRGEGMMALHRGFLYSGASNIISTLFKVYDKPSSQLTQYLFEAILEEEQNYALALRTAKLRLLKQADTTVKSWCGFVLIGEG